MKKVAVFVSGSGSNLQALIDCNQEVYSIDLVISNKENAYGLERAKKHNIKTKYISKSNFSLDNERMKETLKVLQENNIEYIVLAGYLNIIPKEIIEVYKNRIINIHPSLIPKYCGMGFYGEKVHKAVFEAGEKVSGATVHFVDNGVDTGEILLQEQVDISSATNHNEIANLVLEVEHKLLPKALISICS